MLNFSNLRNILQILLIVLLTSAFTVATPQVEFDIADKELNQEAIAEEELYRAVRQFELQKKFEKDVDYALRMQNDLERTMAIDAQALQSKKKLTKKERQKLRDLYVPMPKTVEEYKEMSKDIKRHERLVSTPKVVRDDKIVRLPEPRFILAKYNTPPGTKNIDLRNLRDARYLNSIGIMSPNKDKMVYTVVYYTGYHDKISSEIYVLDLDTNKPPKARLKEVSLLNNTPVKLIDSAIKEEYPTLFKTLTVVDWSEDGQKLAIKERVGSSSFGIWQTNLWVYDLEANTTKQLVEVRDSVKYWLKKNKNITIDDYRWDILPLGWSKDNPDRIIVCAYGIEKKGTQFLGLYSVDYKGIQSEFMSATPMSVDISANGLYLKRAND